MFKIFSILTIVAALSFSVSAQINIVPKPKSVQLTRGLPFEFNYKTKIIATDEGSRKLAGYLNDYLLRFHGFKIEYVGNPPKNLKNSIIFERLSAQGNIPSDEDYSIYVSKDTIKIGAKGDAGMFYGLQSFLQLLPTKIEKGKTRIPAVEILDQPRFKYRGLHLDVARHFMPVSFVKKYIDLMSQYKFNQFHWHLTEDQGWRIEIKKYPKLTEIGSKRPESHEGRYTTTFKGDGIPIEGFYTQEEIKDVVAYAKARHINVIPEIELPGHASAALAAYPQFGCKADYKYEVKKTWGIFKEVFCPTDETFKFLEDILSETIALFPDSPYVHIGADEVLKDHWKESAFVQELKKRENLKDEHEVQSYFVRRIEKFINSKNKIMIGWDEILEGGVAPNAVVMSWRGEKGGIESAKAKHYVIMTPNTYLYLDYGQGNPKYEPLHIGGYLPLETVYSYDPHPKDLTEDEKKYILGAQANIWTEYLKTPDKVEYMGFPRILALSEVNWTPLDKKNFDDFQTRLSAQFQRLDKQNISYRIPEPIGLKNIVTEDENVEIDLSPRVLNGKIFYTLDGSEPTESSTEYKNSIKVKLNPNEKKELKTIVVNEKGRKSVIYDATIWRRKALNPVENFQSTTSGVKYSLFKGEFKSVREFENAAPLKKGESNTFSINALGEKEKFGVIWETYLKIPADGIYEFRLDAKDGVVLQIGDETVVNLDGLHERKNLTGEIPLKAGFHKVHLKYFHSTGDAFLNPTFTLKGQPQRGFAGNIFR